MEDLIDAELGGVRSECLRRCGICAFLQPRRITVLSQIIGCHVQHLSQLGQLKSTRTVQDSLDMEKTRERRLAA